MSTYPNRMYVRMSDDGLAHAKRVAESHGITVSDLVRILLSSAAANGSTAIDKVVAIDLHTANRMFREMRHWGYQRNQANHALNRIAYYLERNALTHADALESLSVANKRLEVVEAGIEPLVGALTDITSARIGFM